MTSRDQRPRHRGPRPLRPVAAAVLAATLTVSCTPQEEPVITEDPSVRSAVEASTRETVDALAAQLGSGAEVQQETWTDCRDTVTGAEVGQEFLYGVRVDLERQESVEEAVERLAQHFEGLGWRVNGTAADGIRFEHEGYRSGASIFVDHGYASVSGSAGCLGTLADVPEQDRPAS